MNGIDLQYSPSKQNGYSDYTMGTRKREGSEIRMISQWTRDDLEDKYLRQYDELIKIKSHCKNQEEKIKIISAKARKTNPSVRKSLDDSDPEDIDILKQRNARLEKNVKALKEKVNIMKSEIHALRSKVSQPYGANPQKSNKMHTLSHSHGPSANVFARSNSMSNIQSHPKKISQELDESVRLNKTLQNKIVKLNEELEDKTRRLADMERIMQNKDDEFNRSFHDLKANQKNNTRSQNQENIDLIRLRRDLVDKQAQITTLQSCFENLQSKMSTLETANTQLVRELDSTRAELRNKDDSRFRLESEVKHLSTLKKQINELEYTINELQRENKILKEENNKLTGSAFDAERERKWRSTESALRTQISQLESTMKKDIGEKGDVLNRLYEEREKAEAAEKEAANARTQYYELKMKFDELSDKFRYFTKGENVDMHEIEEALMIVRQKKDQTVPQTLSFIEPVDDGTDMDVRRKLHEIEIQHAETIQELEKTRGMLVVQYQINKDYKLEADTSSNRLQELRNDYEEKLSEYAKLLDIRAARIHKLEKQIKDIAYGTRQYSISTDRLNEDEVDVDDTDNLEETVVLQRGENLLEIHVGRLVVTETALRHFGDDREPMIFATWDFYEFETQSTAVKRGPRPDFDLTAQYSVKVDDFFLHYLQKDSTVLELHQALGSEYRTLGACRLLCRQVLERQQARNRVHLTAQIIGVGPGLEGEDLGLLEYWVRLRVPMDQALRLYRERSKALGYAVSNDKTVKDALKALDDNAAQRPADNINELHIKVLRCRGVQSRRRDLQPSIYFVYKFFDFPDHDSDIIPSSNSPEFDDHKTFPVHTTADLDRFLKTQPLNIYIFDDTDPDTAYFLGSASIPMIPLAHNKSVVGIFELKRPDGSPNGSIEVELRWRFSYLPLTFNGDSSNLPASDGTAAPVHLLPGEKEKFLSAQSSLSQITKPEIKPRDQKPTPRQRTYGDTTDSKPKGILKQPQTIEMRQLQDSAPVIEPENRKKKIPHKEPITSPENAIVHEKNQISDEQTSLDVSVSRLDTSDFSMTKEKDISEHYLANLNKNEKLIEEEEKEEIDYKNDYEEDITEEISEEIEDVDNKGAELSDENDDIDPTPVVGDKVPAPPPQTEEDNSTDSECVYVSRSNNQDDLSKSKSISDKPGENQNSVVIEISYVELHERSSIMNDPNIQFLMVDYNFVGNDWETPDGLPKPRKSDKDKKIKYNYRMIFQVDYANNLNNRRCLASCLTPLDPDGGYLIFYLVQEPEKEEEYCEELGVAKVSIRDVYKNKKDFVNERFPIYSIKNESEEVGIICVTVKCLAALEAIVEELVGQPLAVDV